RSVLARRSGLRVALPRGADARGHQGRAREAVTARLGAEYVVVGTGSAGAALAGRLAERGAEVLLLEAGPEWRSEAAPADVRVPPADVFAWKVSGRAPAAFTWPDVLVRRFD